MTKRQEDAFIKQTVKRLAKERKKQGLSQERLADLSGIDRVAIGYIEQNRREPRLRTVYRLASAMNMSLSDLFGDR